jgi:ribosomal protein L37AE/L43A
LASIANYLAFFGREHFREVKQGQRRRSFQAKIEKTAKALHTCRVCGLDSESSPKTAFRYCSKCAGQCCYCPEHIQNHEHVLNEKT